MKILITGGAGFIGSHVTRHFVARGYEVCVATRNTYAGKMRNLADVLPKILLLIGDLAEPYFARQCAEWCPELVVHMAAETHVDRAIEEPLSFVRANVTGTATLLQAFVDHGAVQRILVYSTDEVYGPTPEGVAFDEQAPFRPTNAYSASKVGVEGLARAFWATHCLPVTVVRPCNTYGSGQHPEKVIPKFVRQLLTKQKLTLYNDGRGSRDWLHVIDHARGVETLLRQGEAGEAYNMGAGDEHTDQEIAYEVWRVLLNADKVTYPLPVTYVPGRPGHDRAYRMNSDKLHALGWCPKMPFFEGFEATVLWNVAHQDWWDTDKIQGEVLCPNEPMSKG